MSLLLFLRCLWLFGGFYGASAFEEAAAARVSVNLDGNDYNLTWVPDFDRQVMTFELVYRPETRAQNWVLVGFSDHGFTHGSDFCLYQKGHLFDGFLDSSDNLKLDLKQDCHLVLDDPKHARFVFERKFVTCDVRDYAVEIGTTQFLFAVGPLSSKFRNLKDEGVFHDFRYSQLLQKPVKNPPIDAAARTMEIRAAEAHVPAQETTYWCAIVQLEADLRSQKHHVIRMDPIITPGNEHLVHHMEVFHCVYDSDAATEYNGDCNSANKPKMAHMCSKVLAAWAMGAGPVIYPAQTGLPFGGPRFRPLVMVEIHYNNPARTAGIVDNSGFRFTFTPRLREHDAAIMELGLVYSDANSIPPRQAAFPITGYCVEECTSRLPQEGIHIWGTQLHSHLTGRKLWTSQYRNGVKIGEINRDNHFSSHWQHIASLQKHVHVLPGDVLTTTCVYETKNKDKFTFGGYEIENEMCVNYIYYYPASEIEVCKSAVDNSTLNRWFQSKGITDKKLAISEKYQQLEGKWDENLTLELTELYTTGKLNMHCLDHGGDLFKGTKWSGIPQPETFSGVYDKARATSECPSAND